MHPIALWLLSQVGAKLFNSATDALARNIGLRENPLTESRAKPLLDDYSQRLEDALRRVTDRIDLVYLIKLKSAIDQLKRSSKTVSKQGTLQDALNKFSEITNLPEQGQTGGFPNPKLRSIAFLGIAAVHLELQDSKDVIAENIGAAVYADSAIAEQWLGKEIVRKLLQVPSAPFSVSSMPEATISRATSQLIFYDRNAGQGEIYGVGYQGHMSLFRQYRWRTSWTEILPLQLRDRHILLFYDRNAGEGEFYAANGDGGVSLLKRHTWRTSWTQIIVGHFSQNSATGLLFYDQNVGEGEFYSTDGNGEIHLLKRHRWRKTWTQILPVDLGNKYAGLLFYDQNAGEGEFYSTDGNGEIHLLKRHRWRKTWTQILPSHFGKRTNMDLLFYDRNAGEGEFYSADGNGEIHLLKRHRWRKTWTQILPGYFGREGNVDLLFYDRSAGKGEFYSTDERGEIYLLRRHKWRTSWTQIITLP